MRIRLVASAVLLWALLMPVKSVRSSFVPSLVKTIHPVITTIDVPGHVLTELTGINSSGVMTGTFTDNLGSGDYDHGFTFDGKNFSFFNYPFSRSTQTGGINDLGIIVGTAEFGGGIVSQGFFYDGHTFTKFHAPNVPNTYPAAINNAGDVAGGAGYAGGDIFGFVYHDGKFSRVQFPGQTGFAPATGINDSDQITGFTSNGLSYTAYLDISNLFTNITFPNGENYSLAMGINDSGIVVGYYYSVSASCFSYAYSIKTGNFASFGYPGALCTAPIAISNTGQVAGEYSLDDESFHGFVTSPITEADLQ